MLWARVVRGMSSTENEVTPACSDLLHDFAGAERPQESDERLAAAHQRKIGFAGDVVRSVAQHLRDDVGGAEYSGAVGNNLRAFFHVSCVRISCLLAGSGFDDDVDPGLGEVGDYDGNERNAAFSGIAFFGDSDDHAVLVLSGKTVERD